MFAPQSAPDVSAIRVRRVHAEPGGGRRVLVDRLWPRGVRKDALVMDEWAQDVAPSAGLRRAFHGGGLDFEAFREAYRAELRAGGTGHHDDAAAPGGRAAVRALLDRWAASGKDELVLLFAAKDEERTHARVLAEHLRRVAGQLD